MSRKMPPERAHVLHRRRCRVAAGDAHELRLAELAPRHRGGHRRVGGVEAAVEADLERHAGGGDRGQRAVDLGEVQRHRLLAEDRLAGLGGGHDQVGVGVGRRADRDRVDVGRAEQLVEARSRRSRRAARRRRGRCPRCASCTHVTAAPGTRRASSSACIRPMRPTPITPIRTVVVRVASITGPAARRRLPSRRTAADFSSAAWTLTHSSASSKPGRYARPVGDRAAELVVLDHDQVLEADRRSRCPGRSAPWYGKRSPPNTVR